LWVFNKLIAELARVSGFVLFHSTSPEEDEDTLPSLSLLKLDEDEDTFPILSLLRLLFPKLLEDEEELDDHELLD